MHKALCLEPSAAIRASLREIFLGKGWQVELCRDLPDAWEILDGGDIALVVTATTLPSGDYCNVVREVRSRSRMAAVPILLFAEGDEVGPALENGITEVFLAHDGVSLGDYLEMLADEADDTAIPAGRVLVLDDDVLLLTWIAAIFTEIGLKVDCVTSVGEANAAILHQRFDLMVVDVVLGDGASGLQFIRALKKRLGAAALPPVIVISAFCDKARKLDAMRAGASLYLQKPLSELELSYFAQSLLSQERLQPLGEREPVGSFGATYQFSKREAVVCNLVADGHPDKRIAERLGISYWTVRSHMASIFRKCGVMNRVELSNLIRGYASSPAAHGHPVRLSGVAWHALSSDILDALQYAVIVTDANKKIVYVNNAFTQLTGFSRTEAIGQSPKMLSSGKHEANFYNDIFAAVDKTGVWGGVVCDRRRDGHEFLAWLEIRSLNEEALAGAAYVGILSSIGPGNCCNRLGGNDALYDGLTGLATRSLLFQRAGQEIERAKRQGCHLGVLFIDLDRFKPINDRMGHAMGDRVLQEVSRRLQSRFRSHDILARYGGDEFVAIVPDLDGHDPSEALTSKIAAIFKEKIILEGYAFEIGASIGVSFFPEDGTSLEELIRHADRAMYVAKGRGGGQVCFHNAALAQLMYPEQGGTGQG